MTAPVFDPDIAAWLAARAADPTAADTGIDGVRAHSRAVNDRARALLEAPAVPAAESAIVLDTEAGTLPARLLRPGVQGPCPTIVYLHGGGWIAGGTDTHAQHVRRLCVEASAVVVSVDYRLAPEHVFPAAFDDALAATRWAHAHLAELGGDPARVVVAGDSAGAQLAASAALACRDTATPLAAQLLIVPVTDLLGGYTDHEVNALYPSRALEGYGLTTPAMADFTRAYGVDPAAPDWRSSPLRAADLSGAAPAVVHTAGFDPLRDEGAAYARRLTASGVRVIERRWPTLNHGYFSLGGVSAAAETAARTAARDLTDLLSA
ncbi:acetyl esterase [Actinocorallia herbida]|uniref:Acetyl esterase n=1 Tax=Actinocorallia herbida TaxID=58109 RepID=A0A3N1CWQ1_9ACTN|nr:alpha/beta hydrolase [Actinocorallia herbida]ROO85717.1 acetyl esterase [Actinocorallia herbida]